MKKILVANRGEIALRVMRSAREMGIKTIAVYSQADRNAPHVRYADEAVCIGEAPSLESYLRGDKIIEVCKKLKADAIHPGYGFLSENADFAKSTVSAGIIFIGPPEKAIRIMGNKLTSKKEAKKLNIPMVAGTVNAVSDPIDAGKIAQKLGFPVLIKALAGGGGKGMRIIESGKGLDQQIKTAISEAKSSFGDGSIFIEKYIASPKHIEIQVLADSHGNVVHLFERECSIQRRYQKVIEEAPSTVLTPEMRAKMGADAVKITRACGYSGAGTVEFLCENAQYYFLEMNTRLQVEHTVTEFITGVDLVKEQIKIARGEKLSFKQEDLYIKGHAVEARVYAEDPCNSFFPDAGKLEVYRSPHGPGVRVDDGYEEGMEIPIYYDPLISKLITHGSSREEALARMINAINEYIISGVKTTLPFCKFVFEHPAFISGNFDTHFINKYFSPEALSVTANADEQLIAALLGAYLIKKKKHIKSENFNGSPSKKSSWKRNRLFDYGQ